MSILSRIPNLISSTPSSAPQEVMITSQQAHINELVQKSRTLDNTIKDLQDQLTNSRAQWQAEHREWIDGCDSLMACHRIAHLRTSVRLAQERVALGHERGAIRRERVAVIQRDYNLILFKAREKELEIEANQLKEELRSASDGNVTLVAQLKVKLAEGMRELKEKATLLRDAEKAREDAEDQATEMRNEHATTQAQLSSARTTAERLTLRLEDAQAALAEKERLNSDIQQEKAALKVQLAKWKSLDDRGGAEVEELHKQRVALEDQIKRLESRLAEEQSKALVHENASQKEHKKIVKLQQALEEQVRIAEEAKAAAEANHQNDGDSKANKKIQKLMAVMEEQKEKTAKAEEEVALLEEQSQHYKDELDKALRQIEKLNVNSQSGVSRSRSRLQSDRGSDKVEARKSAHSEVSPSLVDSDLDPPGRKVAPAKEPDGKGKKTTKKPDAGKARQLKSQPSASDNKGKRKALGTAGGDGSEAEDANANDKNKKKTTKKPTKTKAQKSQTTAKESHPTDAENDNDDDTEDAAVPKKKKMRKLNVNVFGSSKTDSLDWANQFNLGGGGLEIPTELSPVKVPARSMARTSVSGVPFRKM